MMRELTSLWQALHEPEYLHLLLEPLPLFGLFFGLIFLIAGISMGQQKTRVLSLVIMIVSSASVHWYLKMRVATEPRVAATISSTFHPLIQKQTALRQSTAWIYYVAAASGIIALFAGAGGRGSIFTYFALATFAAAFVHSVWLHRKESEVYHPNIVRYAPPK